MRASAGGFAVAFLKAVAKEAANSGSWQANSKSAAGSLWAAIVQRFVRRLSRAPWAEAPRGCYPPDVNKKCGNRALFYFGKGFFTFSVGVVEVEKTHDPSTLKGGGSPPLDFF